ncbi:hypothetical protein IAQ61_008713 [Plenodomus lingam]|uniref:uncharacterized protein n=1 Tax=Leptosphaeria maculans TaxID=5022 RepID=UPI003323B21E|nr:hypothetical protein IAQ61_008713 [Plenodomus lingam]
MRSKSSWPDLCRVHLWELLFKVSQHQAYIASFANNNRYGYCGNDSNYCSLKNGCQTGYGQCNQNPPKTGVISRDGSCGGHKGYTCKGSKHGDCCSQYGYCGSKTAYCGAGCNAKFGFCSSVQSSSRAMSPSRTSTRSNPTASTSSRCSSATAASSTPKISTNNRCGYGNGIAPKYWGQTCPSSKCCSQYGWCGRADSYCEVKCQSAFGKCDSKPYSIRSSYVVSMTKFPSSGLVSSSTSRTSSTSSSRMSSSTSTPSSIALTTSASTWSQSSFTGISGPSTSSGASNSVTSSSSSVSSSDLPSMASSSSILSSASSPMAATSSSSSMASASSSSSDMTISPSTATTSIASSSSNEASSLSSATPSSSDLASISSSAASTTPPTTTTSSLASTSSTPSTPSTQPCFAAPTEYLTNPGFEITTRGSYRNPWTDSQTGTAYTFDRAEGSDVYYSIYTRNDNNFRTYFGTTMAGNTGAQSSTLVLTQTLAVPPGTRVSVTAWVKSLRDASTDPFSMALYFDDEVVDTYSPTQEQRGVWVQIGTTDLAQAVVVGTGRTHRVALGVTTEGYADKDIFAADDFSVTAVAGAGDVSVCAVGG